jgi:hypothetical protein
MKKILIKILAVIGTVLVCLPLLAPFVFSAFMYSRSQMFRFDYLMPAELFPVVLIGGALLLTASLLSKLYRKLICWSLGIAFGLLIAGQATAVVTGLANGDIGPDSIWMPVVMGTIIGYALTLFVLGYGGVLLLKQLFKPVK